MSDDIYIVKLYNFACKVCKDLDKPIPAYKEVENYYNSETTKQEYQDEKSENETYLEWCKATLDFNIRYE